MNILYAFCLWVFRRNKKRADAMSIEIGDPLPLFTALDEHGKLHSSTEFRGSMTVLFFFLRDNTPICSREACDFRDAINELKARGFTVIGISPNSVASHELFSKRHQLNYPLLSDENLRIAKSLGIVKKNNEIERSTFVIDKAGIVCWVERSVQIEEHISRLLTAIDSLEPS